MRNLAALALVLLTGCAAAHAQPEAAACAVPAQPWRDARTAEAARIPAALEPARVFVGQPLRLRLHPDGEVVYLSLPQGEGEAASFGGLAPLLIERAGTYRVGLEKPSWIDVSADGKPAEATRFGPGAACSGIRKAVEFHLGAGAHVLEISGNADAELGVLVELVAAD